MDDLRNLWDLYTTNSTVDAKMLSTKTYEDTTAEFSTGKVAFYQNGVCVLHPAQRVIYISVEQEQLYLTGFLLKNIMVSWCCVLKILILNG